MSRALPDRVTLAPAVEREFAVNVGMLHQACQTVHRLNDPCPIPPNSPRGRLQRAMRGSREGPAALDRLKAIDELREFLDGQEQGAIVGARKAGCTWTALAAELGTTREMVIRRWGDEVRQYEKAGVLPQLGDW